MINELTVLLAFFLGRLQRSDLSPLTVQRDLASLKRAVGDELSF